jgi:hypothetical protein
MNHRAGRGPYPSRQHRRPRHSHRATLEPLAERIPLADNLAAQLPPVMLVERS